MKKWPFPVAVFLLIGAVFLIQSAFKDEQHFENKAFDQFPLNLAESWEGRELGMEQRVLDILKLSDFMMRVYVPIVAKGGTEEMAITDGRKAQSLRSHLPVWLYVGFYQSQRTGATYHSPKNCLPGLDGSLWNQTFILLPCLIKPRLSSIRCSFKKALRNKSFYTGITIEAE